jgi:malate dehydrogenase (oxaloacetate-decarboxylating)
MGLIAALVAEGLSQDEANARVYCFDTRGLICSDRANLPPYKRRIATDPAVVRGWDRTPETTTPLEVIEHARPGILLGLSGTQGSISHDLVEAMAAQSDRPIIFPLSNPSANADAHPHDVVRWSNGKAIVATGSPFEPLEYHGQTFRFSQANNVYVFPGIGVGAHLSQATQITDSMLVAAGAAVHEAVESEDLAQGLVLPPLHDLRDVAVKVAGAVMRAAAADGVAQADLPGDPEGAIADWQYVPAYRTYVPA